MAAKYKINNINKKNGTATIPTNTAVKISKLPNNAKIKKEKTDMPVKIKERQIGTNIAKITTSILKLSLDILISPANSLPEMFNNFRRIL